MTYRPGIVADMAIAIPLWRRGKVVAHTRVDAVDIELARAHVWRLSSNGYAARWLQDGSCRYLHREILGLSDTKVEADHMNHQRLDNTRANLRVASRRQNGQNRSSNRGRRGLRGTYFDTSKGRWRAYVNLDKRRHFLGYYDCPELAAAAAAEGRCRLMSYSDEARGGRTP